MHTQHTLVSDSELRREAKRIAREQRIPYTKAVYIAYRSLRLKEKTDE
ncbi:hypothetical protein PBI_COUNT_126 [Microbacterium phage Count]|nr:hypothetical protein PBI_COUNT_126 [Microbacterium phage Count]